MSRSRSSSVRLVQLTTELGPRERAALSHVHSARLLTGAHLDRLITLPELGAESASRVRRRIMTRLANAGLVTMLERRIGGVRAGSAGHIYVLTPAGHRFMALLTKQTAPARKRHSANPGTLFLAHSLAISEIYVRLIEASHAGLFRVPRFDTEPQSWWNGLRPDAYTVLGAEKHADCWWLEIDRDTESRTRLAAKCAAYLEFLNAGGIGPDGAPPRVLFTAPNSERLAVIRRVISKVSAVDSGLIVATPHSEAVEVMSEELHKT